MKGLFIYNDGRQLMEAVPVCQGMDGKARPPVVMQRWDAPDVVASFKADDNEPVGDLPVLTFRLTGEIVCTMVPVYQEDP